MHRHAAAQQIAWVEQAKQQIGIGDGRFGIAETVTNRPRIGTRTARTDLKQAAVDIGDRPPPAPTV